MVNASTIERKRILVVEDDPDIADASRELLESEGYTVYVARNGREALEFLDNEHAPCVVILDLVLPELGGDEVLHRIEAREGGNPPLIITTAGRVPGGIAHTVLRKPYDLSSLLNVIHEAGC